MPESNMALLTDDGRVRVALVLACGQEPDAFSWDVIAIDNIAGDIATSDAEVRLRGKMLANVLFRHTSYRFAHAVIAEWSRLNK